MPKSSSSSARSGRRLRHRVWRPDRPWYRQRLLYLMMGPGLLAAGVLALAFTYLFATVPLPDDIAAAATRVLDRDGEEIGTLSPAAGRQDVPLASLPNHVPQAVLAAEDRSFFSHAGVSWRGTARALFRNIQAGDVTEGGSTITQQYIKNAALTPDRTFTRKANEVVLAVKLERRYEKAEILEFYLNTIYWGRGAYGIEAAAQTYFGVSAAELDVNQAAMLAGIIRSPSSLDPAEDPASVDIRRVYALRGMTSQGWLDEGRARDIETAGLPEVTHRSNVEHGPYAYYLDAVRRELAASMGDEVIYRGLTVTTEMDPGMQEAAQETVTTALADLPESLAEQAISAAIVSVDPEDGGVRALVGGPDFSSQQFNTAIRSQRQPGSAFKTFGLAAFIDEGYSPESRFPAPGRITVEMAGYEPYEVSNFGGRDLGEQSLREATWSSTNTVYLQVAEEVGPPAVREAAEETGIRTELPAVPSLILGTGEVTPLEMAGSYATFAAGGVRTTPRLVRWVEDRDGRRIHEIEPDHEGALSANVAHVVTDVLRGVISSGTGQRAQIGRPAAGKTGTTQQSRDAWFVGYVPQLSTAVWVGALDDSPMADVTGGSLPAAMWATYMAEATAEMEPLGFPEPDLSGLEILREPEPEPTPIETQCPDADGEPVDVTIMSDEECPEIEPSPSPSPSPTEPDDGPTLAPTPPSDDVLPPGDDDEDGDDGEGGDDDEDDGDGGDEEGSTDSASADG